MSRLWLSAASMLAAGFVLVAQCASASDAIKIGASISLTTDFALGGVQQRGGIELAVEDANAAGGVPGKGGNRKVEIVFGDNAMSPATAINALNRILADNPAAVLLSIRGTHVLPQLPLLMKAKVPGLTLTGVMKVTKQNNPYIFRFFPHDGMNKPVLIKYIVEKAGKKRVGVFFSAEDYGMSGRDETIATLKTLGLEPVAVESHQPTDKDFSAQLDKFRAAKADIIFLQTFQAPSALILKQARQLGIDIPFALSSQSVAGSALKLVEAGDIEGAIAETPTPDPVFSKDPEVLDWVKRFVKRFGFVPDYQAIQDYDATTMLLKVMESNGVEPEAITAGLKTISFKGLSGTYKSDDEGNTFHTVSIVEIRDLKQIELQRTELGVKPPP